MLYKKTKAKDIIADKAIINEVVVQTIDKMATVVGATLGPGGRAVLLERDGLNPLATKDGVTVARSLGVNDARANIIVESAKEICLNTAKEAGDGTTTAIILANAIVKAGQKFLSSNKKYNPQRVVNELQELFDEIIAPHLDKYAIKDLSEEHLADVATISANGDKRIAKAVVEAVMAAGDDGTVLIEEAQGNELRVETIDGYVVTSGLKDIGQMGPIFINDRANQQVYMENGGVFLYDGTISDLNVLAHMQDAIEPSKLNGKPMIIFAHDFSDQVLEKIAKNVKGGYVFAPVKTPRSGIPNSRSMFLLDMAAYTGASVYDAGDIETIDHQGFGEFDMARCNMYETFVIAEPDPDAIEERVGELRAIAGAGFSDFDKMFVKAAIGKLTGGISTVYVGGVSDLEIREKKARVEDAVEAVRSAIEEGIVPGGCGTHMVLADIIKAKTKENSPSWVIMEQALLTPFKVLLENCGENYDEVWPQLKGQPLKAGLPSLIFDANLHKTVNPFDGGVIEPAKVVRVSISNALSVASLLMTLGGIVVVPRDSSLENQMEMQKDAFSSMMNTVQ